MEPTEEKPSAKETEEGFPRNENCVYLLPPVVPQVFLYFSFFCYVYDLSLFLQKIVFFFRKCIQQSQSSWYFSLSGVRSL